MYRALFSLLLLVLSGFSPLALAAPSAEKLAQEMGTRIERVPEFEFIRAEAKKLGVRVYLFGGTAAAYGHYVRQDMAREAGDTRYPKTLYDYDYTNIFRSTQDLDVVIDGPAEKAGQLEALLKAKFPHFIGDKGAIWEVRPLREARGDKESILGNPDFENQHTDSHSTGLVEVTETPKGESPVKDVRDWSNKKPQFLIDVAEQKLHYYFNPLHAATSRAAKGMNPPILSAIRYLTKAFQYDLEISGEDRKKIQEIIRDFDPKSLQNDYVKNWVEKNGKKLFQHAVDIEYAWDQLESLSLREKLMAIRNDPSTQDSLAWWMNKEPLRTKPAGSGSGKTAAEIFGKNLTFAHETNSFLAYESITRSKAGHLNALISRNGLPGEAAILGNGFYAKQGRTGARSTGITIRMELDPKAKEGADFTAHGDVIVLKNKAAVKVKQEQIALSLLEYMKMLKEGNEFSHDDKALFEAFRRRIGRSEILPPEEKNAVTDLAKSAVREGKMRGSFAREWFALPWSKDYPEIVAEMEKSEHAGTQTSLIREVYSRPEWGSRLEALLKKPLPADMALKLHGNGVFKGRPDLFRLAVKNTDDAHLPELIQKGFSHEQWGGQREIAEDLIARVSGAADLDLMGVLASPRWFGSADLMTKIIERNKSDPKQLLQLFFKVASQRGNPNTVAEIIRLKQLPFDEHGLEPIVDAEIWDKHPQIGEALLDTYPGNPSLSRMLKRSAWHGREDLIRKFIAQSPENTEAAIKEILSIGWGPWAKDPALLTEALRAAPRGSRLDLFAAQVLSTYAVVRPDSIKKFVPLIQELLERGNVDAELVSGVLARRGSEKFSLMIEAIMKKGSADQAIIRSILSSPTWKDHPQWKEKYPTMVDAALKSGTVDRATIERVLSTPGWKDHPEWVEAALKTGKHDQYLAHFLPNFGAKELESHPEWVGILFSQRESADNNASLLLGSRISRRHPEWIEIALKNKALHAKILNNFFFGHKKKEPWLEEIVMAGEADEAFAKKILPSRPDRADWADILFKRGKSDHALAEALQSKGWSKNPELFRKLLGRGGQEQELARALLSPEWKDHPELLQELIRKTSTNQKALDNFIANIVLPQKHWKKHPALKSLLGNKPITVEALRNAITNSANAGPIFSSSGIACQAAFSEVSR